jgi:hypothetical protein
MRTSTFFPGGRRPEPRELGQGVAQHGDVVGDGVGPGVAPPQQNRQRLPGALGSVVEERAQRMEAEPALERWGGLLLLRVRGHQRGIHVDHQRIGGAAAVVGRLVAG